MIGYVYKIHSDCGNILYIGSTIQKLKRRFSHHISMKTCVIGKYLSNSNYTFSNKCELIKEYEIVDRKHLYAYEQLWINNFNNNINGQNAFNILAKEKNKQNGKNYYKVNKDKINGKHRKHYEDNKHNKQKVLCECGIYGTYYHIARHKKTNKHKILLESKEQLIEALSFM